MANAEKTEKPTPKKLTEVSKNGGVARSPDIIAWLGILFLSVLAPVIFARALAVAGNDFRQLKDVATNPDPAVAVTLLSESMVAVALAVAPIFLGLWLLAMVAGVAQGRSRPYLKRIAPSPKKLNPINWFKRTFGKQGAWELVKLLLKSTVVGVVAWQAAQSLVPTMLYSGRLPLSEVIELTGSTIAVVVRNAAVAALILGFADYAVSWRRVRKEAMMTRKEVQDEMRQSEGDPMVKAQLRERARAMSRNRMMANVATADVVLVNPTHIAIALKYTPGAGAPRVVAKGAGAIATRIRELAHENRVPLVEDVPLARTLYKVCEVDSEIPREFYTAVARVLAFVMSLKRRGAATGFHSNAELALSGRR